MRHLFCVWFLCFAAAASGQVPLDTPDVLQCNCTASPSQTNDLLQAQASDWDPLCRFTKDGNIIITTHNVTTNEPQLLIANTTTPADDDTLTAIKVDYSGVTMTSNPDAYGVHVVMPASYGTGTEAAASFNGAGKTVILGAHWESAYFSDGTRQVWLAGGLTGVNTNSNIKQAMHTDDVSDPPTDAELDGIYGTPATVGAGFHSAIDDDGAGAKVWRVWSDGTNWWYSEMTKAS